MKHDSEHHLHRIGDYASYMGVSTDLLKHYEKCGLIKSVTAENGYRYSPFHESAALLDCMRLQKYGFSLRETKAIIQDASYAEVQNMLDQRAEAMRRPIAFQQMVVEEHQHISDWMTMMQGCSMKVLIKEVEPVLFLPHSRHRNFIEDERIAALLPAWVDAMPLAKSCCLATTLDGDSRRSWGWLSRSPTRSSCSRPPMMWSERSPARHMPMCTSDSRWPSRLRLPQAGTADAAAA